MPILYRFSIYRRLSDYYRPRNVLPDFLFPGKIRAVFRNSKGRCHGLYRENGISLCPDRRGKDCSCPPILSKHIELVGRRFERFRKCCVPEEGPRVDCIFYSLTRCRSIRRVVLMLYDRKWRLNRAYNAFPSPHRFDRGFQLFRCHDGYMSRVISIIII